MVFSNIDVDPRDILQVAETESILWNEANAALSQRVSQFRDKDMSILLEILN